MSLTVTSFWKSTHALPFEGTDQSADIDVGSFSESGTAVEL